MGISPEQFRQMQRRVAVQTSPEVRAEQAVEDEIRDLHGPIMAWGKSNGVPMVHANPRKKSRVTPGACDFIFPYKGTTFYVECKDADGELSPDQCVFIKQCADHGVTVHVVTSMEQFFTVVMQAAQSR